MRIDSSGNVGIGTSSPDANLVVYETATSGTDHFAQRWRTQSGGVLSIACSDLSLANPTWQIRSGSSEPIAFNQASNERMRIDSSGNVLVGVTSIADATSRTYGNAFSGSGAYANWTSWGSGTHTNTAFRNGTNQVGSIVTTSTSTSYNTSSDQRLKDNIADANDAGSKIDAIQVRQYDWKADGSHQDYGMIAQELVEVAPEAVSGDADSEEMMGVDYSKLVPMLIKEIQALRNRVAQLEE